MHENNQNLQHASCVMTHDNISEYLRYEQDRGASDIALRQFRQFTKALYDWLPEDKTLTQDTLLSWRQSLKDHGYSSYTELNYIKGINRYLDYVGCSALRFNRGKPKDISGKQFGYLTAIEPTGAKNRKDYVWRCVCRCGKEVEYPATRLLTGNTLSCGCLLGEHFKEVNKYIDGTSLRQSMAEQVVSTHAASGYAGVFQKRDKRSARITFQKVTYHLGVYDDLDSAVAARQTAEQQLRKDPVNFPHWVSSRRSEVSVK